MNESDDPNDYNTEPRCEMSASEVLSHLTIKYGNAGMRYESNEERIIVELLPSDPKSALDGRAVWRRILPVVDGQVDRIHLVGLM